MKKSIKIILIIIFTLISLLLIISSYFGINRYLTLHIHKPEKYEKIYDKLPFIKDNESIIIINSNIKNIQKIKPMWNSLLDQTIKAHNIIIYLPYKETENLNNIPTFIKRKSTILPKSTIYTEDYINSIIPTLLNEKNNDKIIIFLKDNIVYGKDFIEYLIEEHNKNKEKIIKLKNNNAILLKPKFINCSIQLLSNCYININNLSDKIHIINYYENYNRIF